MDINVQYVEVKKGMMDVDHIEIIQRLTILKEQLLACNGGFLNRNVKAVDRAIRIVRFFGNVQAVFVGTYFSGIVTGIIGTLILIAIFR